MAREELNGVTKEPKDIYEKTSRDLQYDRFVEKITPRFSTLRNVFRAFWTGGMVCLLGEVLTNLIISFRIPKEQASLITLLILVGAAVILTGFQIYGYWEKYAGAGLLVPVTGFANSVASPALEYQCEGNVYGTGCKIFTIAGPVILFGILSSWALGILYYVSITFA